MNHEIKASEKKEVEKPVEQTEEKKDAKGQAGCGFRWSCGTAVQWKP